MNRWAKRGRPRKRIARRTKEHTPSLWLGRCIPSAPCYLRCRCLTFPAGVGLWTGISLRSPSRAADSEALQEPARSAHNRRDPIHVSRFALSLLLPLGDREGGFFVAGFPETPKREQVGVDTPFLGLYDKDATSFA